MSRERMQELVAHVAAAYFHTSAVAPDEIPHVIETIWRSLESHPAKPPRELAPTADAEGLTNSGERVKVQDLAGAGPPKGALRLSAADIRRSITPDALISFEDNKPYKTLKRHLASRGLTPNAYRTKWNLPVDYPMVAANYSAIRSETARRTNLGLLGQQARRRRKSDVVEG